MKEKNYFLNLIKILIVILIILIIIVMLILLKINKKEIDKTDIILNEVEGIYTIEDEQNLIKNVVKLQDEREFFNLETILKNFQLYVYMQNKNIVYSMLDEDYINKNNITKDSVFNLLQSNMSSGKEFVLKQVYARQSHISPIYYCYGTVDSKDTYLIVYKDLNNNTYAINPISASDYKDYANENMKEKNEKVILQNQYNKIKTSVLLEEDIANKYFLDYIYKIATNIEDAYELLDNSYKELRFPSINTFKKYLNQTQKQIKALNVKGIKKSNDFNSDEEYQEYINNLETKGMYKYKIIIKENGEKTLICIDEYGNYYTFNIVAAMDYTVILDNHTFDSEEFKTKYNNSTNANKAGMNIEKIRDALNTKDYKYVYEKLDNTFKQNNYPTESKFEEFVRLNLFDINKFEYKKMEDRNGLYIFALNVSDYTEKDTKLVNLNIIIQLKEGTNFAMSFNLD